MKGSGTTHVEGDAKAQYEWDRPRWLRNLTRKSNISSSPWILFSLVATHPIQVYDGMQEPWSSEYPDQVGCHSSWGVGCQVKLGGKQEERDVFQVILVGSADSLHIHVWIRHGSTWSSVLRGGKYLIIIKMKFQFGKYKTTGYFVFVTIFLNLCLAVRSDMSPILPSKILP